MKNGKDRNIIFIFIIAILSIVIMKYKEKSTRDTYADGYIKPLMNYSEILEVKGCSAKDEAVIKKIIANLPANEFFKSSSSRVEEEKLEINIYYEDFKEIEVKTVDEYIEVPMSRLDIISKNITVLFALAPDVEIINVHTGKMVYRYTRNEAKYSYADGNLEAVIENESKLGRFYDLWVG